MSNYVPASGFLPQSLEICWSPPMELLISNKGRSELIESLGFSSGFRYFYLVFSSSWSRYRSISLPAYTIKIDPSIIINFYLILFIYNFFIIFS